MSLNYKNPLTSSQLDGSNSVSRTSVFGTNFSVLQTGGYMEVYSLQDLYYTIPANTTGLIQNSGNTIPIQFNVSPTPQTVPNILTLNSDNISSGRQRLGMLVYVYENSLTYQLKIRNYDTLWNNAELTGDIVETEFGTSVTQFGTGGIAFVNSWTATTIEGVNGYTKDNAKWIIYQGDGGGSTITGGTTSAGTSGTTAITMTLSANNQSSGVTIDMSPAFTFENTDSVKRTVGGITDGSSPFISGKTLHEIVQEIFYPADKPTITYNTVASLTINSPFSNNGLYEINQIEDFNLTAIVTRGQSTATPQPVKRMGLPNSYLFIPPDGYDTIGVSSDSLNVTTSNINGYVVSQGYNTFNVSVDYNSGDVPVYDTGEPYPVPAFTNSGTITKTSRFEGVYPLFANTVSMTANTKQSLVSMIEGNNIQINFTAGESNFGRQYFEVPNAWLSDRSLLRIEQFSTISGQWTTDPYWTQSSVNNVIQTFTIPYTRYTYSAQINVGKRLIRLVFN